MGLKSSLFLIYFNIFIVCSRAIQIEAPNHAHTFGIIGKNSTINKYPFAASLTVNGKILGAGALLNKNWLITAASLKILADPSAFSIHVGSNYALTEGCELKIDKWINHPKFHKDIKNDLALIKIKNGVPSKCASKYVRYTFPKLPKDGNRAVVIGWGWGMNQTVHNPISSASVPFLSSKKCKAIYSKYTSFTKLSFCTDGYSGPCEYDLGAPLVYKNKLIGLFSTSFACGNPKLPSIYTDVTQFENWITEKIKKK